MPKQEVKVHGLKMVMWVLNSTNVWRQFQKDIMNPAINPEKMDVYIATGRVEDQQGDEISKGIDKDGNYTGTGQNGETQVITYGNALKFGVWDFEEGKKGVVLILNSNIVSFIAKNLFTNTKAAINVMKKAALTLYHEGKAHGLDEMSGNKNTNKEDHQNFYGKDVVLSGDYSPSYEEIDINGTSPASKAKKEIDKAGTTIKEKIESIKRK